MPNTVIFTQVGMQRADLPIEQRVCARIWFNDTLSDVICEIDNDGIVIVNMWFSLYPICQRVRDGGGLPVHAL